jgi:hypothetical protein
MSGGVSFPKAISACREVRIVIACGFNIRRTPTLSAHPRRQSSERAEGMPAFDLPVLFLIFLGESFLFQIYWIKPSIFFREVRMKCLRRFIPRCRGSHGSTSSHTLRPVSPYFLRNARFLKNINIWNRGARTEHREASSVASY